MRFFFVLTWCCLLISPVGVLSFVIKTLTGRRILHMKKTGEDTHQWMETQLSPRDTTIVEKIAISRDSRHFFYRDGKTQSLRHTWLQSDDGVVTVYSKSVFRSLLSHHIRTIGTTSVTSFSFDEKKPLVCLVTTFYDCQTLRHPLIVMISDPQSDKQKREKSVICRESHTCPVTQIIVTVDPVHKTCGIHSWSLNGEYIHHLFHLVGEDELVAGGSFKKKLFHPCVSVSCTQHMQTTPVILSVIDGEHHGFHVYCLSPSSGQQEIGENDLEYMGYTDMSYLCPDGEGIRYMNHAHETGDVYITLTNGSVVLVNVAHHSSPVIVYSPHDDIPKKTFETSFFDSRALWCVGDTTHFCLGTLCGNVFFGRRRGTDGVFVLERNKETHFDPNHWFHTVISHVSPSWNVAIDGLEQKGLSLFLHQGHSVSQTVPITRHKKTPRPEHPRFPFNPFIQQFLESYHERNSSRSLPDSDLDSDPDSDSDS